MPAFSEDATPPSGERSPADGDSTNAAESSSTKLRSTAPEYRPRNSPMVAPPPMPPNGTMTPLATPVLGPSAAAAANVGGASSPPAMSQVHPQTPPHQQQLRSSASPGAFFVDYVLVLDFEATCEAEADISDGYVPEIIEFPVVVVEVETRRVVAEFQSFVRPTEKPTLSAFCRQLTGITQDQVSGAPTLQSVVDKFDNWLASVVPATKSFIFATDGPFDLRDFLYEAAEKHYKVRVPDYFHRWIDVKEAFAEHFYCRRGKIKAMLEVFGLDFEGRLHSGIDDARNIARIVVALLDAGCGFPTIDEVEPTPPRAHLRRHRGPPTPASVSSHGAISPGASLSQLPPNFSLPPCQQAVGSSSPTTASTLPLRGATSSGSGSTTTAVSAQGGRRHRTSSARGGVVYQDYSAYWGYFDGGIT